MILDYQFALQLRLRLWVAFHSILTLALVAGGLVHSFMAFPFRGIDFPALLQATGKSAIQPQTLEPKPIQKRCDENELQLPPPPK